MSNSVWKYEPYSEKATKRLFEQLKGVTVATAAPLNADLQLDIGALTRLIERTIAAGSCCIFPLGWCGEGPVLTDSVREELLVHTCKIVHGRVPVMAGVSEQSLPRALKTAKVAGEAGASMILATPPYSYPIPQDLVIEYFAKLSQESSMPLIVYQNDEVGVKVPIESIERLCTVPGVIGAKAYMPFGSFLKEFRKAHTEGRFFVMNGDEYTFAPALMMGVEHFIMGGPGNLCMRWCMQIYECAARKDWGAVRAKQQRMDKLCDELWDGAESPYMVIKYVLSRMGVCSEYISSPLRSLSAGQKKTVDGIMSRYAEVLDPPVR